MHPLAKKTLARIQREKLITPGERVVVAVSGGADSMALLHVLASLGAELGLGLAVAHVNHGLRPRESAQEAELVARAAATLGITCRIGTVDVKGEAKKEKLSIEHMARLLRYRFFDTVADELGGGKIAVAHTADDQAEELLIRLVRGAGRSGLAGMKLIRDGRVIRPFLAVAKEELLAYLKEVRIPWLEDSSNRERIYLRNRVRLDLLPFLATRFNPKIKQTLTRTAAILQDEEELLASMAQRAGERVFARTGAGNGSLLLLALGPFRLEPKAMQRRLVEAAFHEMDHSPAFREIEQVLHLAAPARKGSRLHLRNGLRVARDSDHLRFSYPLGPGSRRGDLAVPEESRFSLEVAGPGLYPIPELAQQLRIEHLVEIPPAPELHRQEGDCLDADRLSFPLRIRSPRPGDCFHPLGAPGAKKIGKFLTDRKIAGEKRWRVPVVLTGSRIVALLGIRIEQSMRITAETRNVLKFTLTGENPLY